MKKLKYSIPGQMLIVVRTHAVTSFVFFFIWLITVGMWEGIFGKIFSLIGMVCYFLSVYSAGVSCAETDKKNISPLLPHPLKGFILSVFLVFFNALVIFLYKCAWTMGGDGEFLQHGWAIFLNILTVFWTSPYMNLLDMAQGGLSIWGFLIIFLVPVIATVAGYFAGYKGFDLFSKILSLAYEKMDTK